MCRSARRAHPPRPCPARAAARICAAGAPRPTVRARSPPASSERYRLENLETLEGERQVRLRLRYVPEFPVVEIVAHPVPPGRESPQGHRTAPAARVERVIKASGFLDHVRFRLVEADVVELAAGDALREQAFIVERDPPTPQRLALWRQEEGALRLWIHRPGELGRHDGSDADRGSEIIAPVAELDMVTADGGAGTHEGLERLALVPHLPGGLRVRSRRLIHRRKIVERV